MVRVNFKVAGEMLYPFANVPSHSDSLAVRVLTMIVHLDSLFYNGSTIWLRCIKELLPP